MPSVPLSPRSEVSTGTGGPSAADQSSVPPGMLDHDSLFSGAKNPSARALRRRKSPLKSRETPVFTLPDKRMSQHVNAVSMSSLSGICVIEPEEDIEGTSPRQRLSRSSICFADRCKRENDGEQLRMLFDATSPLAGKREDDWCCATLPSPRTMHHAGATPRSCRIPGHDGCSSGLIDTDAHRWGNLQDHASRTFSSDLVKGAFMDEDVNLQDAMKKASAAENLTWNTSVGRKTKIGYENSLPTYGPQTRMSLPVFNAPTVVGGAGEIGGHHHARRSSMRKHVGDANVETRSPEVQEKFVLPAPPMIDSTWRMRGSLMIKGKQNRTVEKMFDRKGKTHSHQHDTVNPLSWEQQNMWDDDERSASAPPPMESGWNPVTNMFGRTMRGMPRMTIFASEGDNGPEMTRNVLHGGQVKLMQSKHRSADADSFRSPGVEPILTMSPLQDSRMHDSNFQQRCRETEIARRDAVNEGIAVRNKVHRSNSHEVHRSLQWT